MRISKLRPVLVAALAAISFTLLGAGVAEAAQIHMLNARDALQHAREELQEAVPDKDGHRVDAIHLVDQAIEQVNLGIGAGAQ
ncbi:hypothetical protein MAUB1S_04407 [Mycolicibacterium aubagnense]